MAGRIIRGAELLGIAKVQWRNGRPGIFAHAGKSWSGITGKECAGKSPDAWIGPYVRTANGRPRSLVAP